MFKKLILSGIVSSLVITNVVAEDYMTDIYTSIGSNGNYNLGLTIDHKNSLSSNWSYKNIADKDLYKGSIYYYIPKINDIYLGVGAGIIESKVNDTKNDSSIKTIKPTISGIAYLGVANIESYLADGNNLGAMIDFTVWSGRILSFNEIHKCTEGKEGISFITIGVGADKIQGETEKSVFLKLHYSF